MKISMKTERNFSIFILIVLLACSFKIREKGGEGVRPVVMNMAEAEVKLDKQDMVQVKSVVSTQPVVSKDNVLTSEAGFLGYEEIKKYVDNRYGAFREAKYVPNSVSVRMYDNGQVAVKNSVIEISYDTSQGNLRKQVRKIDVFVKQGGNWVKSYRDGSSVMQIARL